MCEIQTVGEAMVFVGRDVSEGDDLRLTISGEGGRSGVAYPVGSASTYTALGTATETGRGLLLVALNFASAGAISGTTIPDGGTTGEVLTKNSAVDGDVSWQPSSGITDAPFSSTTPPRTSLIDTPAVVYGRYNGNWVDSGLVIDRSGGTGIQLATVNYGERITFVGDGTYIGTNYSYSGTYPGVHEISLTFSPTALDTRWNISRADGQAATPRTYDTYIEIGNTAVVMFLDGVYTTTTTNRNLNYATDYTPDPGQPVNEVTIDVDTTALHDAAIFYYQSEVDALIADFIEDDYTPDGTVWARRDGAWVNAGLTIDYAGGTGLQLDTIGYGETFGIDVSGVLTLSYNTSSNRFTIGYTGSGTYFGWDLKVDASAANTIASTEELVFTSGDNITLDYTPGAGTNDITINLDSDISLSSVTADIITDSISADAAAEIEINDPTNITGRLEIFRSSQALSLKSGAASSASYMGFYKGLLNDGTTADASNTTRNAYIGFGSAGTNTDLNVYNEFTSGNTYIRAGSGGQVRLYNGTQTMQYSDSTVHYWYIGGTAELTLTSSALYPNTNKGLKLGGSANEFDEMYSNGLILGRGGDGTTNSNINFYNGATSKGRLGWAQSYDYLQFTWGSFGTSPAIAIGSNNHVSIGANVNNATYELYVTGDIYATREVVSWSDIRHKNVIEHLNPDVTLELVSELDTFIYEWKEGKGGQHAGYSAQQVRKVFPAVGKYDEEEDSYAVAYQGMTVVNTAAIKALKRRIEELEEIVKNLI